MSEPVEADGPRRGRFLRIGDVADELATSHAQIYAMVRREELVAMKIGGRGQWRIEREEVERYISRTYAETRRWIRDHPYEEGQTLDVEDDE